MAEKQCTKCGEIKPLDQFGIQKNASGTTNYRSQCKACHSARYSVAAGYRPPSAIAAREYTKYKRSVGIFHANRRLWNPLFHACPKCGIERAHTDYKVERNGLLRLDICKPCRNSVIGAKRKAGHYVEDEGLFKARRRRFLDKQKSLGWPGKTWHSMRQYYVNRAAARGMEYWPDTLRFAAGKISKEERAEQSRVIREARQAWRWWIREGAPSAWMREAYRDQPWRNPRFNDTEKWRIQYWCDPEFRASQYERLQQAKAKRRAFINATCDGTLKGMAIVRLFAAAKNCPYCGVVMRSTEKTLDHVIPLSRGGRHSITNVVVCCGPCNTKKHARTPDEWLAA